MVAYHQEVRKLEEKFDGFELHHILRHNNEVAGALAHLWSRCEQPLSGVFVHDLAKPSIRLDDDNPTPAPGTPLGKCGPTPTLDADPGTPPEPIDQAREPGSDIAMVYEPTDSNPDWRKPISEYLWLGAIPDNEIKTRGYLIHDDEMYCHSTSGILQRCIPIKEGKNLLLDTHEGICGHHALSRSMVRMAS
jgi:hypothetical protein